MVANILFSIIFIFIAFEFMEIFFFFSSLNSNQALSGEKKIKSKRS